MLVRLLVGVRGWLSVTRLAGSTELRVTARHVSRGTGAHLQSPRVQMVIYSQSVVKVGMLRMPVGL